jgi:hypothetical protein
MDYRVVGSIMNMLIFVVMASAPAYKMVKKLGVKDDDMSLIVRSLMVGVLTFLSMNINL